MSDTTYIDYVQPAVSAEWLNEINDHVWHDTPVAGTTVHDSSKISFIQSGLGAVSRTMQDKGRETISVKDFGAVGDGVANDSAAFQAAFATGKRVYAPGGTYLLNHILVPANAFLYGDGQTTIIKPYSASIMYALGANSGSATAYIDNITIKNVKFLGDVETLGFSEFAYLTAFNGVRNLLIENCHFVGFRGDGVYIGSGEVAGDERHNYNVRIQGCIFDGVNNENRNAISVIDCLNITIDDCTFDRCSRSDMPGPLDFEPNGELFARIGDCTISNNTFSATCGGTAALQFYLPNSFGGTGVGYVLPPEGFNVINNTFLSTTVSSVIFAFVNSAIGDRTTAYGQDGIRISGNEFKCSLVLRGTCGALISGNTFAGSPAAVYVGTDTLNTTALETLIDCNVFSAAGNAYGAIGVARAKGLVVSNNRFDRCGLGADKYGIVLVGGANGLSENLTIHDNNFTGTYSKCITWDGVHNYNITTTIVYGNTNVNYSNGNFASVYLPNGYRHNYLRHNEYEYDTSHLPDTLPLGRSVSVVNGDTGLPTTFKQGILITDKISTDSAYRPFIVQQFHPANNDSTTLRNTYIRKGIVASNAWSVWVVYTGVF